MTTRVGARTPFVPKLRFPEFWEAPEWSAVRGDVLFDAINNRSAESGLPLLAITQEHGAIPRDLIDYHVSVTAESIAGYKEVCEGDFIISLRSFQGGIEYSEHHGICSSAYVILRRKGDGNDHFFRHLFKSARFIQQLTRTIEGLRDGKMISYAQFSEQPLSVPAPPEQQKIADCLDSLDVLITAQGRKLEALRQYKQGLTQQLFPQPGEAVPRLRFPEFRGHPEWDTAKVGNLVETVTPPMKLTTSEYLLSGLFPIVDQSPSDICGWTNDEDAVITSPLPVIVFGDHTCALKLVDQPFAQGADGIKILTPGQSVATSYLYQFLRSRSLVTGEYKRHFSDLKEKEVPFPSIDSGEQQRIADCLTSLDDQLDAEARKIDTLKQHKRGLLYQLFPSPPK
jgi:type I restriction enzyme S subunit